MTTDNAGDGSRWEDVRDTIGYDETSVTRHFSKDVPEHVSEYVVTIRSQRPLMDDALERVIYGPLARQDPTVSVAVERIH